MTPVLKFSVLAGIQFYYLTIFMNIGDYRRQGIFGVGCLNVVIVKQLILKLKIIFCGEIWRIEIFCSLQIGGEKGRGRHDVKSGCGGYSIWRWH